MALHATLVFRSEDNALVGVEGYNAIATNKLVQSLLSTNKKRNAHRPFVEIVVMHFDQKQIPS